MAELSFDVGVCRQFLGCKLVHGDVRWPQHTAAFYKETHTIASLAKAVAVQGASISGVMKNSYRLGSNFVSSQVLGLDFDTEDERSTLEALERDDFIASHAAILYETLSSTPDRPRARVLFVLDQPVKNASDYMEAMEALVAKFPDADQSVKDTARFFYGRPNARHVVLGNILYRDILQTEVIEPYLRAQQTAHRPKAPTVGDVIPEGQRNNKLASMAGSMRHRGMSEAAILAALLQENEARCQPPLAEDEVAGIASSISRTAAPTRAAAGAPLSSITSSKVVTAFDAAR